MPYKIAATQRINFAKRSKDERLQSRIPAVVYGHGVPSAPLSIGRSEFLKVLQGAGRSSLIDMSVAEREAVKVLIKEVQVDPRSMEPIHVDFYQVRMDEALTAEIPLKFVGDSKAVKMDGGTLVKSLDKIEIRCLPADLPHEIEVDLSRLATFEDAITVADLGLPRGVVSVTDTNLTIATVARPLTEEELKKLDEVAVADVTAIKTEGEEKKAAEAAEKAQEEAAEKATKA